jgi:hypothetical protein
MNGHSASLAATRRWRHPPDGRYRAWGRSSAEYRRAHRYGGLAGPKIRPVHGGLVARGLPPQPGDGYLRRRDERHGAAGLQPAPQRACLPVRGVRSVRRLAASTAGHVDGELSTGGDVQLGEHVGKVGLHGST